MLCVSGSGGYGYLTWFSAATFMQVTNIVLNVIERAAKTAVDVAKVIRTCGNVSFPAHLGSLVDKER